MKYILVGLRDGQKSLNVPFVLLMMIALPLLLGGTLIVVAWVVLGEFDIWPGVYGAFFGLALVLWGILSGLRRRKDKLPDLDG